jgi:hypothetical protein
MIIINISRGVNAVLVLFLFPVCSWFVPRLKNKSGTLVFTVCSRSRVEGNACTYTMRVPTRGNACTCIQYCVYLHIVSRLFHIGIIPVRACGCKVDIVSADIIIEFT